MRLRSRSRKIRVCKMKVKTARRNKFWKKTTGESKKNVRE